MPVGASATFTVTATVSASATGTLVNTATVSAPAGVSDPVPGNNSATDTDTLAAQADLTVTKSGTPSPYVPGSPLTYTVTVTNLGPSVATNARVQDPLPAPLAAFTWTCVGGSGGTCTASGSGAIDTLVSLPVGGTATFTITGTVPPATTGSLDNTATVTPPAGVTDPVPGNNIASNTSPVGPVSDLRITKSSTPSPYVPGLTLTYTIVVTNAGPSNVTNARVQDVLPAPLGAFTWTCTSGAGTCGTASGTGNIDALVSLPSGATATFTVTGPVPAGLTGPMVNTATVMPPVGVTDPVPGDNSATDTNNANLQADLSVTKSSAPSPNYVAGAPLTYTIVVMNLGPSNVTNARLQDSLPASLSGFTWTCASGGGSCGTASGVGNIDALVTLPVSATATFTVTGSVPAGQTGVITNTATVTAPAGVVDPVAGNNQATDNSQPSAVADLAVTKTSTPNPYVPGLPFTYTIVVSNLGPSNATNARLQDTLPTALGGFAWTCAGASGGTCGTASGAGSIDTLVTVPVGGTVTITVSGVVPGSVTGSLVNTATIATPAGVNDPVAGNNSATDVNGASVQADLSITKTDGAASAVAGATITYTVVATNGGPSDVVGATVSDALPAAITGATWTCTASAGSACPASGSGNIAATVTLLAGGTATFTITGTVSPTATGSLSNTATVAVPGGVTDPTPGNNTATDVDTIAQQADLSATKTDGVATAVPGAPVTYTMVVTNAGPSAVTGATVSDTLAASLTGATWTCVASPGSVCPASGAGNISASVDLAVGGTATFTVTATVNAAATGTLVNSVSIAPPAGVTDPVAGNNSATDTDTLTPRADLTVTKSSTPSPYVPGLPLTYTIVATNIGPSVVTGAQVVDPFPAAFAGFTWTCVASAGSTCAASGSVGLNTAVTLLVGGTATFTVSGTVPPATTGTQNNTVTITPPAGVTDPVPGNNSASNTSPVGAVADLRVTKASTPSPYVPGAPVQYVITATNVGPSSVVGARVQDTLPAVLTGVAWTCGATGGASCGAASGAGTIDQLVSLPVGGTVVFTVNAGVPGSLTGVLTNSVTITPPTGVTDPVPGDNQATDNNNASAQADLSVTKTSTPSPYVPGGPLTYTIVVANAGPSNVLGARVQDALPAAVAGFSWSCAATGGAACGTLAGIGDIDALVDLPTGTSATFTVSGTVSAAASGPIVNTATVAAPAGVVDPVAANNAATNANTASPSADLGITKAATPSPYVPGLPLTYTMVATNAGPSNVVGARVQDVLPAPLSAFVWTCVPAGGATCGTLAGVGSIDALVSMPVGAGVTFTVTGTAPASGGATFTNTATITAPAGVSDPVPANNTATAVTPSAAQADLQVVKTASAPPYVPGGTLSYVIVVTNAGPSAVTGARLQDALPAPLSAFTWTCGGAAGGVCGTTSGTGNLDVLLDLPLGGMATFTITGTVPAATTGTLTNTATIATPAGTTDPVPGNNSSTVAVPGSPRADLAVSKSSTPNPYVAGTPLTYTVTVSNAGPSNVVGARVQDVLPAPLSAFTWTCAGASGGACATASGTGDIDALVTLPVGATATLIVSGTVPSGTVGQLLNTATVTPPVGTIDPVPGNNTAVDANPTNNQVDLAISKASTPNPYVPGQPLTYTVIVSNLGPSDAVGARVQDVLPTPLAAFTWACVSTGGGVCNTASGSGNIDAFVDLVTGASVTFTVTGPVPAATTGALVNTATVTAPAGVTDPVPGNNTASNANPTSIVADLSITKASTPSPYVPGLSLTYTIVVANAGPSNVTSARVQDVLPGPVGAFTWTCVPGSGASCGTASGSGSLDVLVSLAAGASATFTITGTVPPGATGALVNTATITPPATVTDPVPGNNTASNANPTNLIADLSITKTSAPNPYTAGSLLTYTVVVSNAGPGTSLDARVQDVLPAPLSGFAWTCAMGGGGVCGTLAGSGDIDALVTLPPSTSVTFTLAGIVPPGTVGSLVNTATVTPPAGSTDPTPGNQTSTNVNSPAASGQPSGAELYLQQTFPPAATAGGQLTFSYTSTNRGPGDAVDLMIDGMIPAGTTFVSAIPSAGGVVSVVNGMWMVTWPGNTPPGAVRTVTLVLQVDAATPPGAIVASWIMTSSQTPDPYHFNDMVDSYVFVGDPAGSADLVLQGQATGIGAPGLSVPAAVGQPTSIRLRVTNNGGVAATAEYALILDEFAALRVTAASTAQGWVAVSGPSSGVWDTGVVAPGQSTELTLEVVMQTAKAAKVLVMRVNGMPSDPSALNDFLEIVLDGIAPAPLVGREVAVGPVDDTPGSEIVTAAGRGETPQLRIFSSAGVPVGTPYYAFPRDFLGGVGLASCDVDGDGRHEIIAAQASGGSDVRVLRNAGGIFTNVVTFTPFETGFTGGVSVACADLDGDGRAEVVVGAGAGRAADVRVFTVAGGSALQTTSFMAYESAFTGGVRVSAARYLGGVVGPFQIVTTPGPGRTVDLRVWNVAGASATLVTQAPVASGGGAYTALGDANNDGQLDLAIMPDAGTPTLLTLVGLSAGQTIGALPPGALGFTGGMRLAIGPLGGGPGVNEIVAVDGAGGVPRVQVFQLFPSGAGSQRLGFLALEVP